MKNIFKILLISCISSIVALQSIGQATDGVCADPSSIDPLEAPAVTEVCSDGTTVPPVVFAPPASSLPNVEFVVEVNGTIVTTNADGSIDPTTLAVGDQVCASAVGYSQAGVNDLLMQFQPLCGFAETLGQVPPGTCAIVDGFIAAGGVSSLQDLIDVATAFGVPIGSVTDIVTAVDGINGAVGGFGLPFICYASSAPACYMIIECGDPSPDDCEAMAGEAVAGAPAEVCNDAAAPVDAATLFDPATGMVSTNYVAVDANGDIVAVTAAGSSTLDLSGLADGETACIYQLAYTQETLDAVTGAVDNFLCMTACVDVPFVGLTCIGDIGYCPGVTPVELAPFLDILNGFFGFNETQICNFIDNQIITIPDPTGVIGDQEIVLADLGVEFCVDKSEPYCVTVSSAACDMMEPCAADAPTISIDCTDCGDGTTGGPCTVTDAGDGSANAGEITEYLVIDDAAGTVTGTPDGIISVGALTAAQAAVDGLADGETVCVTAITHISTELDVIIAEIEAAIAGLGLTLGLPATGNTLAAVYAAIQGLAGGATVDLATIETLIANGAGGTVDLGAALGLPAGILTVDLSSFCYNVDPAVCVTGATCGDVPPDDCEAMAGEATAAAPTEVCNDAATPVDATTLFDPATGMVSTNYVAVDANGDIVAVTAAGSSTLDLSGLADGETACIYQLAYTQETLDAVTGAVDNFLCMTACVDVPFVGLTCIGDIGYCPGVTPVELAPFLDILNGFFGFNETQICNFIDNQVITIPDPTGLIGDQEIVLADLGVEFCVDKSEPYCVTVSSAACDMMEPCAADAPTISIDCTDCGDGTTGGPCTVTDAGDGSANAGEITEYLVIDDAAGTVTGTPDGIISVGALAAAQAAVDGLADGETVCVTAITHISTELDVIIAEIEAAIAGLGLTLGLPATGNTLAAVYAAIQGLAGGATVDLATIETLIANGAGGTVDLGAALGLPAGLLTVDLSPFCYNVDPAVCVTGATCGDVPSNACTAMAGEAVAGAPAEVCNEAANPVDASTIFDPATGGYDSDGDGVVDAMVSTNYIAVDAAGNIVAVTAAGATTLDLSALADGETACIYQLAYTQGTLDAVTGFVDNLLCSTLCVPVVGPCLGDIGYCPGVTPIELAGFLDFINGIFGFNEAQICDFIDNQILTIPDPTGLFGDQMLDLVALGIDFCVDKSNVYCVTVSAAACGEVMGCTDMCAPNYDATATMDDGSCEAYDMTCNTDCNAGPFGGAWDAATCACINETAPVNGCTDATATNYDAAANCDDGSCIIPGECNFSVGVSAFDCNNGGTMEDPADDSADITFVVLSNGSTWTSDVAIGGVTAGGDGMMLTEMGVAAGTNILVTFTSDDDPNCTFVLDYTVPDCTVQIPTLSQWGLMSLALLLMIFGSLKLSANLKLSYRKG